LRTWQLSSKSGEPTSLRQAAGHPSAGPYGGFTIFSHARFRLRKLSWTALLTCGLLVTPAGIVALAGPASAVAPGSNGKIVYNSGDGHICVMNADGSGSVDLTPTTSGNYNPTWSPAGSKIAFTRFHDDNVSDIYAMNADGTGLTQLTDDGVLNDYAAWSPDGTKLAFDTNDETDPESKVEIHLINADGTGHVALTNGSAGDAFEPAWSPDASSIAYDALGPAANSVDLFYQIWQMQADGSNPRQVTTDAVNHVSPSWSPDGTRIAFGELDDTSFYSKIRTSDLNGQNQVTVTSGEGTDDAAPSWSPDGRLIAFERVQAGILVANPDGSGLRSLSAGGQGLDWASIPAAGTTAPGAPTSVTATAGDRSATVSWTAPASDGGAAITKYTVRAKHDSGSFVSKEVTAGTSTTFTGLTNETQYTITVTATNSAGTGPASSPVLVTPTAAAGAPGPPTGVTAVPGDGSATVSWTAPASSGGSAITGYAVLADPAGTGSTMVKTTSATTMLFDGLTNGVTYTIKVKATNAAGYGEASLPVTVTPAAVAGVPGAPSAVSAVSQDGAATVSWTAPASDGGSGILDYLVRASSGETAIAEGSPFTMTGLANDVSRTFTVTARNAVGYGPASAPSNAVTFHPKGITALTIARQPSSILPGRPIDVSGRLQGAEVANKLITITVRSYHAAPRAYTTHTDAAGTWRLRLRPFSNATYTASFTGDAAQSAATSATTRTDVHALVTLGGSVTQRGLATLVGHVSPNAAGRLVYLVEQAGGRQLTVARGTVQRDGSYRIQRAFGDRHPTIRVLVGAFPGNLNGASEPVVV
jgi:Tol biopolymer transport system component